MKNIKKSDYKNFIIEIKKDILISRNNTLKLVNKKLVELYFKIGEKLSKKIDKHGWGKSIIEELSNELKKEFIGIKGFSKDNLWRMIKFYRYYNSNSKLAPLVQQISWSNNIVIIEKCKTDFQIEYYLKLSAKTSLSKRVLQNKIESHDFERILTKEKSNNFNLTLEKEHSMIVLNTIKDSYIFDFLSLGEEYKERDLEENLLKKLKSFILELGIGFAYVGNQYNLEIEGKDYFLDMLFYHTKLKCYIVIELKIGEFKLEYAGKLNFYINIVDDKIKNKDDNATIGLLICKEKNKGIVEYSIKGQTNPLAISKYSFKNLPKDFQKNLPKQNQIEDFLNNF